jgi:hypothetical protein
VGENIAKENKTEGEREILRGRRQRDLEKRMQKRIRQREEEKEILRRKKKRWKIKYNVEAMEEKYN